jgi:hypothetical protein
MKRRLKKKKNISLGELEERLLKDLKQTMAEQRAFKRRRDRIEDTLKLIKQNPAFGGIMDAMYDLDVPFPVTRLTPSDFDDEDEDDED